MTHNKAEGYEQSPEIWPCRIHPRGNGWGVTFDVGDQGLLSVIVAALELEHSERGGKELDAPSRDSLQIVYTSPLYIIDGNTWQQVIQAHINSHAPGLASHLEYSSSAVYFVASSSRITYLRQLAAVVHALMGDITRVREGLRSIGREDILHMIPVRNLSGPGSSIGVKKPEANKAQVATPDPFPPDASPEKSLLSEHPAEGDEVEELATLAYETYMADAYRDGSIFLWERLNPGQRQHWRASARAVMNKVLRQGRV